MQQPSARRIAVMRFLCGVGEQFSATDFHAHAIEFSGHRFLLTAFKVNRLGARAPVYYCRCGELAAADEASGNFVELGSAAPVGACRLAKRA